jgi:small GTP-binding protein
MSGKYALVIGNTKYTDPGLAQLTAPGRDTEEFAKVLKDICAFDDVQVLINPLSSSMVEAIDELFDQKKSDDLLVLYFAGHGVRDEIGALYLAVKNTIRTRLRSTAIKSDYIRETMDHSRSKRQVLVLDCTNSGSFAQGMKYETGGSAGTGNAFGGYGRVVIAASDRTQFAWEGDRVIGKSQNSLLTYFLIEGLQGKADVNADGHITIDELYDYAYERISLSSPGEIPGKWASKQEGEIILRHLRFEDVTPVPLPDELMSAIKDKHPDVRKVAVEKLGKILTGKNIGMARSAKKALEQIASEQDTTRRIAQLAIELLESVRQAEENVKGSEQLESYARGKDQPDSRTILDPAQRLILYSNAKVVLVGDTGVGKSGLALVLTNQSFAPTDSTHGRRVSRFDHQEVELPNGNNEVRETILWDLAGQPGYRLIHQLDLQDVDVALIVFDARSETNPIAGIMHWIKALEQSEKIRDADAPGIKKILVAARTDRGPISLNLDHITQIVNRYGFLEYFETSAKEGWNIAELSEAIRQAIDWDSLFRITSNLLLERIKNFLSEEKLDNHILSTLDDLYRAFLHSQNDLKPSDDLRAQFDICVSRIESLGMVRSLSFGTLVLLQPEILASYASALINTVKSDPEGLGSISEDHVRNRNFFVPTDEAIKDPGQEKLLLIAMLEDLLKHEIALREGGDLIFPTQLTRENPELSDPDAKSVIFEFEGSVLNIYATLVVRLSHSYVFKKKELWKNAATFTSQIRGMCGIFLKDYENGHGTISLFYDNLASEETRFQFEEYVQVHIERFAVSGSVKQERIFACSECNTVISNIIVTRRRERGFNWLDCPVCSERVWLLDPGERLGIQQKSSIDEIDEFADAGRRREINASVLQGKIETNDFDVFLCHNSQDKRAVKELGEKLKSTGILPWLDEWELRPGLPWQRLLEEQISKIKAAAVFVGPDGIGPWQRNELDAFLRAFVERGCPVIPVLLPTAPKIPNLPIFLQSMTWVDFRKDDPEPLERLIWGITGERVTV